MHPKVLVTYATRMESTSEVAEVIGMILREQDVLADVLAVDEVTDFSAYKAAIIGSAVRNSAWLPEAVEFIKTHYERLQSIPVVYFTVCMTMRDDTDQSRRTVESYVQPVLKTFPEIKPLDMGFFGGMFDGREFPRLMRWIIQSLNFPTGDFRDWEAVHHWTKDVYPRLLAAIKDG